jgi:hypothetical protein
MMLMTLPTGVGRLRRGFRARELGSSAWAGVFAILARGRAEAMIERERRATLAVALSGLAAGFCLMDRDAAGGERFIGPAGTVPSPTAHRITR